MGNSPGPPFHVANSATLNMETQPTTGFVPSQRGKQMELPSRDRASDTSGFTPSGLTLSSNGFPLNDNNEMDTSPDGANNDRPSPSTTTSQSRGGSTSHTSYSPGQQQEDRQQIPFLTSPKDLSGQIPLPHSTTVDGHASFFPTSDDMFSALYGQSHNQMSNESLNNGFLMGNDWGVPTMDGGTGMTPMSEGSWNQMLESINLGLDSLGPPHGNNPIGR